jgi:hypothetical protein
MPNGDEAKAAEGATANPGGGDGPAKGPGKPLFTSYIYAYGQSPSGMGGEPGGKAGLGGPGSNPLFVVHTFPFIPPDSKP